MPDYTKAKIYKLWSPEGDEIYIGSTTQSLSQRKSQHKMSNCKSTILFEKYNDVRIELLEEYDCDNKEQLLKKEGEYIRNNKCVNRCVAGRSQNEYYKENKEYLKKHIKEYYENNKEHIKEQKKEYYENNKEQKKKNVKEYRENNKEQIKENRTTPFLCECGKTIQLIVKARHLKSKIHNNLMDKII